MKTGVVGIKGVWTWALLGAVGLAAACGSDDNNNPPPGSGGSAGASGKVGSAGTVGTAGKAGSSSAGAGGTSAGSSGKGGTGTGGMAGAETGATGGKGGSGNRGGTGGTSNGTSGEGGVSGEGGANPGNGGKGGSSGRGGSSGTGTGTSGHGGSGGHSGNVGVGGTSSPGGEGGMSGEAGASGASGASGESGASGAAGAGGAGESTPNLFFSEYVEPTGTNPRALEIINKSGATMDLSGCSVVLFSNAATAPSSQVALTGSVANNDVFVLCSAAIGTSCDQVAAGLTFDGNDGIALRCGGTRLDLIGQLGTNPGTEWGNATVGTQDQTLRRKCSVTIGDRNSNDAFDPSTQWVQVPSNSTAGLGSATCG